MRPFEIIHCEQGSEAWYAARCGRITGTRFADLMAGATTKTYENMILDIVGEILTGEVEEGFSNDAMQRGKDLEPEAREAYEDTTGNLVEQFGFIVPDAESQFHDFIGISPDGLLIEQPGMIEIKCPLRKTHLNYLIRGKLPADYYWQVHGQLFVTGLEFCDFFSYYPGLKPLLVRVEKDQAVHEQIEGRLLSAIPEIKAKLSLYERFGK